MNLFAPLPRETRRLLDGIPALIDKTFPLPGRFRSKLPSDIAELSHLLTSGRGERGLSYLGRPNLLSAYLRFFLPWNLYRLCRLLPGLGIKLRADDLITDLGCGPFTLAAALWVCRPDLRALPLEFHCIDRSGPALEAGRIFFAALTSATLTSATPTGENSPWKIRSSKAELGTGRTSPAALVSAANVFNEMYGDISRCGTETLKRNAEKSAHLLESHCASPGGAESAILVVEPGFPRCGEFISLLRNALMERGHHPLSPCPHDSDCPLLDYPAGGKKPGKRRWCHFAFETEDAPRDLQRLSLSAKIPKERAVLSFVFMGKQGTARAKNTPGLRVISDAFPLPHQRFGRYACSGQGLVLLAGEENAIGKTGSGTLVDAAFKKGERDPKSGALLAEL